MNKLNQTWNLSMHIQHLHSALPGVSWICVAFEELAEPGLAYMLSINETAGNQSKGLVSLFSELFIGFFLSAQNLNPDLNFTVV